MNISSVSKVTYPEFLLLIDALGKGINDTVREFVLAHIEILKALVATQVGE